jgi:hypothetical protein
VPKEGVPRAVDHVEPVLNKAPADGHLKAAIHPSYQVTLETLSLSDAEYEEYLDQIRKNKGRYLAKQAALRALALEMEEEMNGLSPDDNSSDDADEEMPELDPDSDAEEEEDIPDLQPGDDKSATGKLTKALKAFLDRSEEG